MTTINYDLEAAFESDAALEQLWAQDGTLATLLERAVGGHRRESRERRVRPPRGREALPSVPKNYQETAKWRVAEHANAPPDVLEALLAENPHENLQKVLRKRLGRD